MVFIYKSIASPRRRASTKNGTKSSIQGVGDGRGKRQSWDSRIIVIPAYTLIAHHLLTMLYSKRCLFLLSISLALGNMSLSLLFIPFLIQNLTSPAVYGVVRSLFDTTTQETNTYVLPFADLFGALFGGIDMIDCRQGGYKCS